MKTFIIAEAGANHNRDIKNAFSLIDVAKNSGASAVKFQTYSSETLYARNAPNFAKYKNINQLIKEIELPREWQKELKQYCDASDIEFMSTPFDEKAVDELVELGIKRLKIAGFESTDYRFIDMVASTKLPLIISIGIGCTHEHISKILDITSKYNNSLTLLHCNNAYPTPMTDIDLEQIPILKNLYNSLYDVGLSDHTESILTPSLAVAKGATMIEKHYTLSRYMRGPDHPFAIEPEQLKQMVDLIVETEKALTPNLEVYSESEKEFICARRSVVSKRKIKAGDVLCVQNITTKRPLLEDSIPADQFYNSLGKIALCDIESDTPLTYNQVQ